MQEDGRLDQPERSNSLGLAIELQTDSRQVGIASPKLFLNGSTQGYHNIPKN